MDFQKLNQYVLCVELLFNFFNQSFNCACFNVTKLSDQQSYNNLVNQNMTKVSVEMNLNILFISSVAFGLLTCMLHLEFSL